MNEEIAYISNDMRCALAMKELRSGASILKWTLVYYDLFLAINDRGNSTPYVARSFYRGRHFINILKFHRDYLSTGAITIFDRSSDNSEGTEF